MHPIPASADRSDLRSAMVKIQLKARGITDTGVLAAMGTVPREKFVPQPLRHAAYKDHPLGIGFSQTISQPYVVALTCQLLNLRGDENLLDIGTGSGYQAAVLSLLARHVTSLEVIQPLATAAATRLKRLGYKNITVIHKNGRHGYPPNAPYHAIVSAAAASQVPQAWIDQLMPNGIVIMPQTRGLFQYLTRFHKTDHALTSETISRVRYVPLINNQP